jgi:hypothetical protein
MGPYAGVLTLCPLQSRLKHIYHGQPYAIDDLNLTLCQSRLYTPFWIWPQLMQNQFKVT